MAARASTAPRPIEAVPAVDVADPQTARALGQLRGAIERLESLPSRVVVQADLVVGTNKVRHGLGRPVVGYTLTPTVASAAFAHAIDRNNPRPESEVWIVVIGAAQPGATLEVY